MMLGPPCQSVWTADVVFEATVTAAAMHDGETLVNLRYRNASADRNGFFEFDGLSAEPYVIGVNLSSGPRRRAPYPMTYHASKGASADSPDPISLDEAGFFNAGPIVASRLPTKTVIGVARWLDGSPAANVRVWLLTLNDLGLRAGSGSSSVTDAEGRFTLEVFEAQGYSLRVSERDGAETLVDVGPDQTEVAITVYGRRRP